MVKKIFLSIAVLAIILSAIFLLKQPVSNQTTNLIPSLPSMISGNVIYNDPQYHCPTGMISYFELGEGSGNTTADSYGSNIGIINNATWISGKRGNALQFNGIDNYVEIPYSPSLGILDQFTIEAWINIANIVNGDYPTIFSKTNLSDSFSISELKMFVSKIVFSNLNIQFKNDSGSTFLITSGGIQDGWNHVAATYNGTDLILYINGTNVSSLTAYGNLVQNINQFAIGRAGAIEDKSYFNGTIDEVAIYNTALSPAEIAKHYNSGAGKAYCLLKCSDEIKDGDETDIDCGGSCSKCSSGKSCLLDSDCQSNSCLFEKCASGTAGEISITGANLRKYYMPGTVLDGTFNLSLKNYPADAMLKLNIGGITKQITLLEFIKANNASYSCSPANCYSYYTISSSAKTKVVRGEGYLATIAEGDNINATDLSLKVIGEDIKPDCGDSPLTIDLLNDNINDWKYLNPGTNFCYDLKPGDYYSANESTPVYRITSVPYCEKIALPAAKKFRIGADIVKGNADVLLKVSIGSNGYNSGAECTIPIATGMQTCDVDFTALEEKEYFICIRSSKAGQEADQSDHLIKGERTAPNCGFSGAIGTGDCSESTIDFGLYGQAADFANFNENTDFDENHFYGPVYGTKKIASYIQDYLQKVYGRSCAGKCIIPFKISSTQSITFSNLNFLYTSGGIAIANTDFYEAQKNSALISMNSTAMKISTANLRVPVKYGNYNYALTLEDSNVDTSNLNVERFPTINLYPQNVSAAVSTRFLISTENASAYYWDFGDGTTLATNVPYAEHTYSSIKTYTMTVTITTVKSMNISQTFTIYALAPKDLVNSTLIQKAAYLNNMQDGIDALPEYSRTMVVEQINLSEMRRTLALYQADFLKPNADYISLKNQIESFVVYKGIRDDELGMAPLAQSVDLELLKSAGAGKIPANEEQKEKLKNKISAWQSNIEITIRGTVKVAESEIAQDNKDLLTLVTIDVNPLIDLGKVFLVIKGVENARFPENTNKQILDKAVAFTINPLTSRQTIEFAVPGRKNPAEFEAVASSDFNKYEISEYFCGNQICDKGEGEDYSNCPEDCKKPFTLPAITIILIIAGALAAAYWIWKVYAMIYEKKLEEKLFKNKADMYNLTFFITKALNKGDNEESIKQKLITAGWGNEQVEYAVNKIKKERRAVQINTLLNFITIGLKSGKTEETIINELKEAGWNDKDINYAYKKASARLEDEKKKIEKAAQSKKALKTKGL